MPYTKKHYYLRLRDDFFERDEIILLENMEGGFLYVGLYLKLLCKSEYFKRGYRYKHNKAFKVGYSNVKSLSAMFSESVDNVKNALETLEKVGLVIIRGADIIIKDINIDVKRNRTSKEYREWRTSVFERDNFTCVSCKQKGKKLNAHHIKEWANYPDLRFEVDNGITLCESCHKKLHKKLRKKITKNLRTEVKRYGK